MVCLTRVAFVSLIAFLFTNVLFAQNIFKGNVELRSQSAVDEFGALNITTVEGYLLISGDDITNLASLGTIERIEHSLFIEYNYHLDDLNGLNNLNYVGGSLFINNNYTLDTISTFQHLEDIKGHFKLKDNVALRDCCVFFPILTKEEKKRHSIVSGNRGCLSFEELVLNCDDDADNDGVPDEEDACPLDSLKTVAGFCGCGQPETDTDGDGTPDCKDACPNNPQKQEAGVCGCSYPDVDIDNNGVIDCEDSCKKPSNVQVSNGTNRVIISWQKETDVQLYEFSYQLSNQRNWQYQTVSDSQIELLNLIPSKHYDYKVRAYCTNQNWSPYTYGTFATQDKASNNCQINKAYVQNIQCQDNGTPDKEDDYFLVQLYVEGKGISSSYKVLGAIDGDVIGTYGESISFKTIAGLEQEEDFLFTVKDTEIEDCTQQFSISPEHSCSEDTNVGCGIRLIEIEEVTRCDDRGTIFNTKDDRIVATITVHYDNPPANGLLKINKTKASVKTSELGGTVHTFKDVWLPAAGKSFDITATFTETDCRYTTTFSNQWCYTRKRAFMPNEAVFQKTESIAIYPNPAKDELTVFWSDEIALSEIATLKIRTISGKEVLTRTIQHTTQAIDISILNRGLYFVEIIQGAEKSIHKLMKE